MRNLVIGFMVLCVGLDLALGMTLFRDTRQGRGMGRGRGGGRHGGRGGGHRGGHRGPPTLEELTQEIKQHLDEYNNECTGVTTGSCDAMNSDIDTILNEAYSSNPSESTVEEAFWSLLTNAQGNSFEEIHCTIRNCFAAKMYQNYQNGKRMSGCTVEEEEQEFEQEAHSFEEEDGNELCAAEIIMETCELTESNGAYTVDADACASALAQKIYDKVNSAQRKRKLVEELKRMLLKKGNRDNRSGADSDGDVSDRSLDSDGDVSDRSLDGDSNDSRDAAFAKRLVQELKKIKMKKGHLNNRSQGGDSDGDVSDRSLDGDSNDSRDAAFAKRLMSKFFA